MAIDWSFFNNATFWVVLAIIYAIGFSFVGKFVKRVPVLGDRKTMLLICVIAFALTAGLFGTMGIGSISGTPGASVISDLQITTTFLTDAGGTVTENSNVDDLMDLRFTDAQANETTAVYELDTGLITVTRSGSLDPASIPVSCIVPADYADEAGDDGKRYNILEKTTIGEFECYLADGAAATTSSPKMKTMLAFGDGVAVKTLGIALEVDEEGHDALNQYSYKDVIVQIGNMRYTMRIHRMD